MKMNNSNQELSIKCGKTTNSFEELKLLCKKEADKLLKTIDVSSQSTISVAFWCRRMTHGINLLNRTTIIHRRQRMHLARTIHLRIRPHMRLRSRMWPDSRSSWHLPRGFQESERSRALT